MRTLLAVSLSVGLLASMAVPVHAQTGVCGSALRDAPMETVPLPEGWQWDALLLESSGMPGWALLTQDPTSGSAYALIYCSGDAAQLFARRDAVDRAVGVPSRHAIPIGSGDPEVDGRIATEVVLIGDESRATHDAVGDFTTLQWRNGDIVGEIRASGGLDFADVEEFALALDTLLPGD